MNSRGRKILQLSLDKTQTKESLKTSENDFLHATERMPNITEKTNVKLSDIISSATTIISDSSPFSQHETNLEIENNNTNIDITITEESAFSVTTSMLDFLSYGAPIETIPNNETILLDISNFNNYDVVPEPSDYQTITNNANDKTEITTPSNKLVEKSENEDDNDNRDPDYINETTESDYESVVEIPAKKAKNGKADPSKWKQNHNKILREKAQTYLGKTKENIIRIEARSLKPRCNCDESDKRKCALFSEADRQSILDDIWKNKTWDHRHTFVISMVDVVPPKQKRSLAESSRRSYTFQYHLKLAGIRIPVCKKMFLASTDIGEWSVRNWVTLKHDPEAQTSTTAKPMQKHNSHYNRREKDKQFLKVEFLGKLPKLPSHYCRSQSSKLYLEREIQSMSHLYSLYVEKCREHNKVPVCRQILQMEFELINLSIFRPRKDQCDLCAAHEVGNVTDDVWSTHVVCKDAARLEKSRDKGLAEQSHHEMHNDDKIRVITMDLQAVLLSPKLKASALYYKTKLAVHNFTIYNLANHDVRCYIWHEGEVRLTANEFASCLSDYLNDHQADYKKIIIYSDGCGYQNRNALLSNTLQYHANTFKKIIEQKFLERGHTQMEVDSVHSVIERKLKHADIYCPANYVQIISNARKNPRPYDVKYVEHNFFRDFNEVGDVRSIRPGTHVGDPTVTNIRCLKYTPNAPIQYKIKYGDDYIDLPKHRRVSTSSSREPKPLYTSRLKIKPSKFQHLQELKEVFPRDYHPFYDSLEH